MALNFNYDQNFTNNWVKTNTKESEEVVEFMTNNFIGLNFVKTLFRNYPELFDDNSAVLFYIEYAGRRVNSNYLYLSFEQFMTNSNTNVVKAMLNNIPLYTIKQDPVIQWARYLQATSKFTVFEPVLTNNNNALKSFINNSKTFHYKNIPLSISSIKPLCVNNNGENVAELLIYIAYLFNFFINLCPYVFNEVVNGSSTQIFMLSIEEHINEQFNKLITLGKYINPSSKNISNEFRFRSVEELYSDVNNIKYFDVNDIKSVIKTVLNNKVITDKRNRVLQQNDPDLTKAIGEQNNITDELCYKGYLRVMENLIDIVVKHNYFNKHILSKLPVFNQSNYSLHELVLLTSYALSGGNQPFIINDYEQYEGALDPKLIKSYPKIDKQQLTTKILPSKLVNNKPFVSSNVFLEIISGYLYQEFETYQAEVFSHPPILTEEKDIKEISKINKNGLSIDKLINALYLNGKFNLFTSQMKTILDYLTSDNNKDNKDISFNDDYNQVLLLADLCAVIYKNKFGSMILPAYILSYLPEYVTKYCAKNSTNGNLNKFSFIKFFCLEHNELNMDRIIKLANMEMSLLYLHNRDYTNFVNETVNKITKILTTNAYIIQPYVIGTSSNINVLPIGGITLGTRFIDTNPLTRGYYFVVNTQGTSEELYTFYTFIKSIGDKEIRAYLYANKSGEKSTALDIIYNEMNNANKTPLTLSCFKFDKQTGKFTRQTNNFYKNLKTSNGISIDELLNNYSFNAINAKDTQEPKFYSRTLYVNQNVSKPMENAIMFNTEKLPCSISDRAEEYELPYYDFSTLFKPIELSFVQPNGYSLLKIYTPNSELIKNNLFFVFTPLNINDLLNKINDTDHPLFNVYDTIQNGISTGNPTKDKPGANIFNTNLSTFETSTKRLADVVPTRNHTFSTTRMKIIGKDTVALDSKVKY